MMRKVAVAIMLAAVPAVAHAQNPQGRARGMGMGGGNVPEMVLQHKADLAVTDDQAKQLEALAKTLHEKNDPIMKELREARQAGGMSEEQRTAMQPKMDALRKNNADALEAVKKLLNEEQNTKLDELMQQMRRPRRGGGGGN